jgi:hypothetical protein
LHEGDVGSRHVAFLYFRFYSNGADHASFLQVSTELEGDIVNSNDSDTIYGTYSPLLAPKVR